MVKRIRSIFSVNTSESVYSCPLRCQYERTRKGRACSLRWAVLWKGGLFFLSLALQDEILFSFSFFFHVCADALECFSFVWFAFVFVLSDTQSTWIYFVLAVHLKAGQLLFQTPWDSHCCGVRPCCARSGCSLSLVPAPLMLWMVGKDENL